MPSEAVVARLAMPRSRRRLCVRVSTVVVASERSTAGPPGTAPSRWVALRRRGVRSRYCSDMRTPPTPSVSVWWKRWRSAPRPSGSPSTARNSHRGRVRSNGSWAKATARSQSASSVPGSGRATARTWQHMSKSGSVRHSGGARRPSAGDHALAQAGHHGGGVRHADAQAVEVERPIEQRDVGEARREVRILLEVPHDGLEVRHARSSCTGRSAIARQATRRRPAWANDAAPTGPAEPGGQRGMEVCLNSLSSGYPVARSRMRSIARRASSPSPAESVHEAHEHGLVADDERGDAPHVWSSAAASCSLRTVSSGARRRSRRTPRRRRRRGPRARRARSASSRCLAVHVAGVEERRGARPGRRRGSGHGPRRPHAGRAGRSRRRVGPRWARRLRRRAPDRG